MTGLGLRLYLTHEEPAQIKSYCVCADMFSVPLTQHLHVVFVTVAIAAHQGPRPLSDVHVRQELAE